MSSMPDEGAPCDTYNPRIWFDQSTEARAKALCRQCPIQLSCLDRTLETERDLGQTIHGVHGGLNPVERAKTTLKRIA